MNDNPVFVPESGLYQNFLVTGTIGSGKTASALYPFTRQLIDYFDNDFDSKLFLLILDVKGNYYSKVLEFAHDCNRLNDVIVIEINGKYRYNPLDKPSLLPSVLANRLKEILLLFSPNNSESFWIDKSEQVIEACISFCRIYNDGYVSFDELHNLITDHSYYLSKLSIVRDYFISRKLSDVDIFNLYRSINFLENDFYSLDDRNLHILQSEITRITNCFVSNLDVKNTFCPSKEDENFCGFHDALHSGKIVILNMNIAKYKNLSKIIAAYLKLDFQSDVLEQLSNHSCNLIRPSVFISDEYQEYVTSSDASFFSQSREAKCISIVSTQSYTSILNAVKDQSSAKVIIQSLVNKIWFRTDDIFTIEEAQKQLGKEDKIKYSRSISENAKETKYNYLLHSFKSDASNLSESISTQVHHDFIYDTNAFSVDLKTFHAICFISTGSAVIPAQHVRLTPIHEITLNNTKFI